MFTLTLALLIIWLDAYL